MAAISLQYPVTHNEIDHERSIAEPGRIFGKGGELAAERLS